MTEESKSLPKALERWKAAQIEIGLAMAELRSFGLLTGPFENLRGYMDETTSAAQRVDDCLNGKMKGKSQSRRSTDYAPIFSPTGKELENDSCPVLNEGS
jgi:hypothetical protein